MSAGFKSVTDTSVIEALDFEYAPPCERTSGVGVNTCDSEAEWSVTYVRHCVDGVASRLVCGVHSREYFDRGDWVCLTCHRPDPMTPDRILRIERIKP